jgi:lipoyl(octanoyl) transferase
VPNSGPFPSSRPNARTVWIGRRRYGPVLDLQRALVEARTAGKVGDTVLFLEHEPTITLGRGAHAENVLTPPPQLAALGVDLVETERGGDVTFHAPGQLVVYPIIDLAPDHCDVRRYVQSLARCMINLAAEYGVQAGHRRWTHRRVG